MFSVVKVLFSITSEGLSFEMKKKKQTQDLKNFKPSRIDQMNFFIIPKAFVSKIL